MKGVLFNLCEFMCICLDRFCFFWLVDYVDVVFYIVWVYDIFEDGGVVLYWLDII